MLISPGMTIELWPHPFSLEFIVTLKDDNLRTDLRITNTGTSSFKFQSLLHTYFKVNEVTNIRVDGFSGCNCKNQLTGEVAPESNSINTIDREVDNIYLNTRSFSGEYDIRDITLLENDTRALIVSKEATYILPEGARSDETILEIPVDVVFWNPWIEKARSLADLPDEAYHNFVCIEPGLVQDWVALEPGYGVSLAQLFRLLA